MTLEDYIHAQLELRADITVKLGCAQDGSSASLMTWSNTSRGTHFWDVSGNAVKHLAYVGSDADTTTSGSDTGGVNGLR